MKKLALFLVLFSLFCLNAQGQSYSGQLTAASTVCQTAASCLVAAVSNQAGAASFTLSGTFSGTVQFEATGPADATGALNWQALSVTPTNSTTTVTSATGTGVWQANVAGFAQVRMRVSTYASGTVNATTNISTASARTSGGGSGGSGTVTGVTGTAPISVTASTTTPAVSITGAPGQVLAGATPAFTATPALGTDGSVAGTLQLGNSAAAFHSILGSVATANNTVNFFATAPATGDLIECVTATTTCTLTDAGVLASAVLTASSTNTLTNKSLSEDQLSGANAAKTLTEVAAGDAITRSGIETANLTAPYVATNANSTNNNTSISFLVSNTGTSTGAVPFIVNHVVAGGTEVEFGHGGSVSVAGVMTGFTADFQFLEGGAILAPSGGSVGAEGNFSVTGGAFSTTGNVTLDANGTGAFTQIIAPTATSPGLLIQMAASPTADMTDWQSNTPTTLASVGPTGILGQAGIQIVSGADYTNSTVTPSTVFSWTLPPTIAAKTYYYTCDILWESTAATLVGPVFGVNISAAPTQLTASGVVQNTLAGADVNGYLSNTTTGSQTVVTGGAAGVTSTNYWAKIFGTIEGAPTAGSTFIINAASTSGTTASLNIRRGSSCEMTAKN